MAALDAADWWVLAAAAVCYAGTLVAIQWATWTLGAATVSLLFGLRLVLSVAFSKAVLGATTITTGVQVGGAGEGVCRGGAARGGAGPPPPGAPRPSPPAPPPPLLDAQIAGVVVVSAAVTLYAGWQWRESYGRARAARATSRLPLLLQQQQQQATEGGPAPPAAATCAAAAATPPDLALPGGVAEAGAAPPLPRASP